MKQNVVWVRCSLPRSLQGYAKGVIEAVSGKFSETDTFQILDIKSGKWFTYKEISGVYVRVSDDRIKNADPESAEYCSGVRDLVNSMRNLWVLIWDEDELPEELVTSDWTVIGLYLKKVVKGKFPVKDKTKSWIVIWKNSKGGIQWQDVKP